jgi:DNA-binding CsgD family transcriptional regulator
MLALGTRGLKDDASSQKAPQRGDYLPELLMAILVRLACGFVIADQQRRISFINGNARKILELEDRAAAMDFDRCRYALQSLLGRARTRLTPGSLFWVAVSHKMAITKVIDETSESIPTDTCTVILLDLDSCARPSLVTLQRVFGLSVAEAILAIGMVQGVSPDDIAASRSVCRTTIRSQLASVLAKTQTRRQAELVARLGRLAFVP